MLLHCTGFSGNSLSNSLMHFEHEVEKLITDATFYYCLERDFDGTYVLTITIMHKNDKSKDFHLHLTSRDPSVACVEILKMLQINRAKERVQYGLSNDECPHTTPA